MLAQQWKQARLKSLSCSKKRGWSDSMQEQDIEGLAIRNRLSRESELASQQEQDREFQARGGAGESPKDAEEELKLARPRVRDRAHQVSGDLVLFRYSQVLSFVSSMIGLKLSSTDVS